MPIKFEPNYTITPKIVTSLLRIESAKEKILHLPLTPTVLSSLRETAKLYTTHYSTMIEGNRLEPGQIEALLKDDGHFPGRERDEHEVKGYYEAFTQVEKWAARGVKVTENMIKPSTRSLWLMAEHLLSPQAIGTGRMLLEMVEPKL